MKKKHLSYIPLVCLFALCLCSCKHQPSGICHIQGVVDSDQYEGKRIFLVPFTGPATAETVDSVEIKDRQFTFTTDTVQMYKILLDYHYRMGIQPLLIVGEPGVVKVTIGTVSHAVGTPQNDSLEQWKVRTELRNQQLGEIHRRMMELGNPVSINKLKDRADSINLAYKKMTRQMASNMKEGVLHEFLKSIYPTTYKKKLPDGRIVTINADTNEEIPE